MSIRIADVENAQRWMVQAHLDSNTCDPCKKNRKKTYKNRQEAYEDYPEGKGYKKCVGAEFGNRCRCIVRKRRKGGAKNMVDLARLVQVSNKLAELGQPKTTSKASWYEVKNRSNDITEILMYGDIGSFEVNARDFVSMLGEIRTPEIHVRINTLGGLYFEGTPIYEAMLRHPSNITSYIDGMAASAGSFIAMGANKVVIAKTARFFIHNAQGMEVGDHIAMRKTADLLEDLTNTIAGIYARRAGGTVEEWLTLMSNETTFDAEQALRAGLADEIEGEERDDEGEDEQTLVLAPSNKADTVPAFTWDAAAFKNALMEGFKA